MGYLPASLRTNLRWRLTAVSAAIVSVAVGAIGWIAFDEAGDESVTSQGRFLGRQAQELLDKADRNLFERYGDVQAFAFHPHARGTPEQITAAADFYCRAYGVYDLLVVTDAQGSVVATNGIDWEGKPLATAALRGRSVAQTNWFKAITRPDFPAATTHFDDLAEESLLGIVGLSDTRTLRFAAPIRDESGAVVGTWMNCASPERVVSAIVRETEKALQRSGFSTAEVMIATSRGELVDGKDSRFRPTQDAADRLAELNPGESAFEIVAGPELEEPSLIGFARADGALGFAGYDWRCVIGIAESEALAAATRMRAKLAWVGAVILAVGLFLTIRAANGFARPIVEMTAALERLAAGDLRASHSCALEDEIGRMSRAFTKATASIRASFDSIRQSATTLAESANELDAVAADMAAGSEQTTGEATRMSAASEQVSSTIHFAAQSLNEMKIAVTEISRSTAEGARCASEAAEVATAAGSAMAKLDESSRAISGVVNVINSIAAQTNLLALNATIEAARAGDSGKGFAVVANEVKELANETAKATEDITRRISTMESETRAVVEAIAKITSSVRTVNDLQNTIASAVEEQSANSAEISRSVTAVSDSASSIATGNAEVVKQAAASRDQVTRVREATTALSRMGDSLRASLGQYQT